MNFYAVSRSRGGGYFFILNFFMEETGRVKTDLGECNLNFTRKVGECLKILVFNPVHSLGI